MLENPNESLDAQASKGELGSPLPFAAGIEIRPLTRFEEFRECVRLQEEVWGQGFSQKVPEAILIIASRLGGIVCGAFGADGTMAGFVFGLTGMEEGRVVHWSDMLAVRAGWRRRGIGSALKLHQRELLIRAGVTRMYWTFDPLEVPNARLNFSRLGVVVREYVEEMYGESGPPLHLGIGTDRFVAVWEMASSRVKSRIQGGVGAEVLDESLKLPSALEVEEEGERVRPGETRVDLEDPRILVPVPADIQSLKEGDVELARCWRRATRTVFRHYLSRGWELREVTGEGNPVHYLLVREVGE